MEIIPKTKKELLTLIGDYALDSWMYQIMQGQATHSTLNKDHAMLIYQLILLLQEGE